MTQPNRLEPGAKAKSMFQSFETPADTGAGTARTKLAREQMKRLRKNFSARGIERAQLSLSGYWAAGRTEDAFQNEKREPVGQIF